MRSRSARVEARRINDKTLRASFHGEHARRWGGFGAHSDHCNAGALRDRRFGTALE